MLPSLRLAERRVLLIIAGGIAAYKSPELIRRLQDAGAKVRCVVTEAGTNFVSPLTLSALSGEPAYQDMFSLTDESKMGHIRLAREADLIIVAPATANLMAKMAHGLADDLASTLLLAATGPILLAPSMNTAMWSHPATQANVATLKGRGLATVGPDAGDLACGEVGAGRMAEIAEIVDAAAETLVHPRTKGPLSGRKALVTSGPTREPIDPVRFIANRSSGKQGHAIAAALAALGADVTLISGPVEVPFPPGVTGIEIETAEQMLKACQEALPVDVAVCAAAVADWRVEVAGQKLKKQEGAAPPTLTLIPNPDILATVSAPGPQRPPLVIGFAAETENLLENARRKRIRKGCDWICANDVSPSSGTFGGESNRLHVLTPEGVESWPSLDKAEVARRLATRIAETLASPSSLSAITGPHAS